MSYTTEYPQRAAKYGFTNRRDVRCPRTLVGKRCRNRYQPASCWCSSWLNDHGGGWTFREERVILWEPYGAGGEELARVLAAATADGLDVRIDSASPWNPGSTVAIRFSKSKHPTPPTEPAPFPCSSCGRAIGKYATHHVLEDRRVVCSRCYTSGEVGHARMFPDCPDARHIPLVHSATLTGSRAELVAILEAEAAR